MRPIKFLLFLSLILLSITMMGQNNNEIDSLEQAIILSPDNDAKADLYISLSKKYMSSDIDKSLENAKKALELSELLNIKKQEVSSHIQLCQTYKKKNEFKKGLEHANIAKEIAEEEQFSDDYAMSMIIIANIYAEIGKYKESAELCFEALKVFEQIENYKGVCIVLNQIGGIYYMQGEFDEAEKYFLKLISLSKEKDYLAGLGKGLTNISAIYDQRGQAEKAIDYLSQGSKIFKQTGDLISEGICYSNIALYYMNMNKIDSTYKYLQLSIDLNESLQNYRNLTLTYAVAAKYYLLIQDTLSFLDYANKTYNIAHNNDLKGVELQIIAMLEEYYTNIKKYDSAHKYSRLQYVVKDSLDRKNSLTRLSQLEMAYEIDKEDQERELREQRRWFIIGFIILTLLSGIIVLIFALLRYRERTKVSKLRQQKLEDEIHFKNKELTTNVMSLMKKNEMLTDINERLIEIQKNARTKETKKAISSIAFEIENNTQEKIWEEFEIRFKQVHSDFYNSLITQYPDLSPNEIRLCAFLKLNLSTKEISSITGKSLRSLEVARYRLRKKMAISSPSVNLTSFISRI